MRTQVCIIGGGPSGLLLSQLLHLSGVDTVILERRTREHVLSRIRAGVLEWGSVELLHRAGVGDRMDREGFVHEGTYLAAQNRGFRLDLKELTGRQVMVYGQTEVTQDLYRARDRAGGVIVHEAEDVTLDVPGGRVAYVKDGVGHTVVCDWIVGCDGFHGVSRKAIPDDVLQTYERVYPFGWLGVLSETPPVSHELIYANHERGFALCSMRNMNLSRYYLQAPLDDPIDMWTDARFWDELRRRIPHDAAEALVTGPSIEKSIAPLRSFVAAPMRWSKLLLVGDAAHIVPPTGAKGLNLALGDVHYAHQALTAHYQGDASGVEGYSERALRRVWQAMRFSWWMTRTLHRFPDQSNFDQKMQESELAYLEGSRAAQAVMAEQYTGVPL